MYDVATSYLILATNAIILRTRSLPNEFSPDFNVDDTEQLDTNDPDEENEFNQLLKAIDGLYREIRDYFLNLD